MGASNLKEHNLEPYNNIMNRFKVSSNVLYISTMGSGKSFIAEAVAEEFNDNVLVVVFRNSLIEQWKKNLPNAKYINYYSIHKIAEIADSFSLIIFDEVHHIGAKTYKDVCSDILESGTKVLGLTATEERYMDVPGRIIDMFGSENVVRGLDMQDAIDKNILPPFHYIAAYFSIPDIKKPSKGLTKDNSDKWDYLEGKLNLIKNSYSINDIFKKHCTNVEDRRCIIFIPQISVGGIAENLAKQVGFKHIYHVNYSNTYKENKKFIELFEKNTSSVLISVDVLSEGLHVDGADTLIFLRRTKSPGRFKQMVGRVMSTGNMGKDLKVFDMVGILPTLGEDGSFFEGETPEDFGWEPSYTKGISDQVIVDDYTKDIRDITKQLEELITPDSFTEEDDEILKKHYGKEKIDVLLNRFGGRHTKVSISFRARQLGLKWVYRWSEDELEYLRENYSKVGAVGVAKALGVDAGRVVCKAHLLGLEYNNPSSWSQSDLEFLEKNYSTMTNKELVKILGRTESAIQSKARNLNLNKVTPQWEEFEDDIIRKYYAEYGWKKCSEYLEGRNKGSIVNRANYLGIYVLKSQKWTPEEDNVLSINFGTMSYAEIAKLLPNRTRNGIQKRVKALGLT